MTVPPLHPQLVLPAGRGATTPAVPLGEFRPRILRTQTESIAALAAEFAVFTPGLLHTYGDLRVDPVAEFVGGHSDRSCEVCRRDFDRVLFAGIARDVAEEAWDRRLYFIERKYWDGLRTFLSGVVLSCPRRRIYCEVRADLCFLAPGPGELLPVPVTTFGLSGNRANIRLASRRGPGGIPAAVNLSIEPDVARRAQAAFAVGPEAVAGPRSHT